MIMRESSKAGISFFEKSSFPLPLWERVAAKLTGEG
jgi:hypothetical protein